MNSIPVDSLPISNAIKRLSYIIYFLFQFIIGAKTEVGGFFYKIISPTVKEFKV